MWVGESDADPDKMPLAGRPGVDMVGQGIRPLARCRCMIYDMATPHATIPDCPNCQAHEKAVLDLDHGKWYCFNCGMHGTMTLSVDEPADDGEA